MSTTLLPVTQSFMLSQWLYASYSDCTQVYPVELWGGGGGEICENNYATVYPTWCVLNFIPN